MRSTLKDILAMEDLDVNSTKAPGPVITISREFGCEAHSLSQKLCESLDKLTKKQRPRAKIKWKFISKEILEKSAHELDLRPHELTRVFEPHEKNFLQDMMESLQHTAVNDRKVHKTVKKVISNYARKGHVIIIGRGGVSIAGDIKRALHIRLIGPLQWKAEKLAKERNISVEEGRKLAVEMDKRRSLCIENLRRKPYETALFHMVLNRATMTIDEMAEVIMKIVKIRELY